MGKTSDFQDGRHAVFNLHVHLVFVTIYRRKVFDSAILDDLQNIFNKVCLDYEAERVEFDGEEDHVHLLMHYPRNITISNLVNRLKGASNRLIRSRNYPSIRRKIWGTSLWSPSYFAGSYGGALISIIQQYIEQQNTPD